MADHRFLKIYLSDHLAGFVALCEVADRVRSSNEGTPLGEYLGKLADEFRADRAALEAIMENLGAARNPAKHAAMWVAEKLGRLKLNGQLTGYSPLSRLLELEALRIGAEANLALWQSLGSVGKEVPELGGADFTEQIDRAALQKSTLELHHAQAAAALER